MPIKLAKPLLNLLLPSGLMLLVAMATFRWSAIPKAWGPTLQALPPLFAILGIVLAWRFHQSRVVYALMTLLLAYGALQLNQGKLGLLAAFLLPVGLAYFGVLKERGLLTARGIIRLAGLAGVAGCAYWAAHQSYPWVGWISKGSVNGAYGAALAILLLRFAWRPRPMESGFVSALVASWLALSSQQMAGAALFATAAVILIVAVIETSHFMAFRDELTGLPARRALNDTLLQVGAPCTIAMVDVDHFKKLNDKHGHDVGDQALRFIASKLDGVSGGGRVYRYGGEEFTVVFPGKTLDEALPHLEQLRKTIESNKLVLRGRDRPKKKPARPTKHQSPRRAVPITVSIGVAERDGGRIPPERVIKAADQALYKAKKNGRNQVVSAH